MKVTDEVLDHRTYKLIKGMNRAKMEEFHNTLVRKSVRRGYEAGIREATIALFSVLHKAYGFGNVRIERLLDAQALVLQDIRDGVTTADALQEALIQDKVECLIYGPEAEA